MEFKDYLEMSKAFYKMGFSIAKTILDLTKVASDSYVSMYEFYMRQIVPSESFDSIKKTIELYNNSQAKVFENFKKLIEQVEKSQDEMMNRLLEVTKETKEPKK
uniref:Phasin family protein n=1 Tax=Geoglobus ahangari TaxID=113653 RepID=A0A7C4W2M2_9EURY